MSVEIISRAWKLSKHKGSQLLLLLAISDMANNRGFCWPSAGTLAEMIRMSERHTSRMYNHLAKTGELYIRPRDGSSNYFVVLVGMTQAEFVGTAVEHLGMTRHEAENEWAKIQIARAKWESGIADEGADDDDEGGPGSNGAAPAAEPPPIEGGEGECECDDEADFTAVDPRQLVTPQDTPDNLSPPPTTLETPDKLSPRQVVTPDIAVSPTPDIVVSDDPSLTDLKEETFPKGFNSSSFWREAIVQIQGTMTRDTFNANLMGSWCEGHEGNTIRLVVKDPAAAVRVTHRLNDSLCRTLSMMAGHTVRIQVRAERPDEREERIRVSNTKGRAAAIYARPAL